MTRVTKCVKDNQGNPRAIEHPTLFVDHSLYEVTFPNVIADSMLSQVDS